MVKTPGGTDRTRSETLLRRVGRKSPRTILLKRPWGAVCCGIYRDFPNVVPGVLGFTIREPSGI